MTRLSHVVSFAVLGSASLGLAACPSTDRVPNPDHCANQAGDASCVAWNISLPYCGKGPCYPDARDGCVAVPPEDPACYSPCGGGLTLADDPDGMCLGGTTIADSSTTMGSASSVGSSATTTSTGASTDDTTGATTDPQTDTTVSSSDPSDSSTDESSSSGTLPPVDCRDDSDCEILEDPLRSVCADDFCVQCDNADARGCDDPLAPVCSQHTCVPCSTDDLGACEGTDTPVCVDDACVPCSDDDLGVCAEQDLVCSGHTCVECLSDTECQDTRQNPVCDSDTHTCVPCTAEDPGACEGTTPICDPVAHACEPCTTHDACADLHPNFPGAACHLDTGACLAGVWHVDVDDDACDDDGPGSAAQPFCGLDFALAQAGRAGEGTIILHESDIPPTYDAQATLSGNLVVAILGAEGETPRIRGTGAQAILVSDGATLYLDNVEFSDSTSAALRIDDANARIQNTTVTGNRGIGIEATNGASVLLENVIVSSNDGGIEATNGASVLLENAIVSSNGGVGINATSTASVILEGVVVSSNQGVGLRATGGATLDVHASRLAGNETHAVEVDGAQVSITNTFATHQETSANAVRVANGGTFESLYSSISAELGNSAALDCTGGTTVVVRNSILVKAGMMNGQALRCDTASVTRSVLTGTFDGATDSHLEPLLNSYWFHGFPAGDLHLNFALTQDFLDIAAWQTGDPLTDIDGDPRTTDGATDFPGADVPELP